MKARNRAPRRKSAREENFTEWFYKKEDKKRKSDKPVKSSSEIDEERRKLLEELGVTGDGDGEVKWNEFATTKKGCEVASILCKVRRIAERNYG